MKRRDQNTVAALRSLLAAIANAEAVDVPDGPVPVRGQTPDVPRRELTEAQIYAILQREVDEHQAAADDYARLGKVTDAAAMRAQATAVAAYL